MVNKMLNKMVNKMVILSMQWLTKSGQCYPSLAEVVKGNNQEKWLLFVPQEFVQTDQTEKKKEDIEDEKIRQI